MKIKDFQERLDRLSQLFGKEHELIFVLEEEEKSPFRDGDDLEIDREEQALDSPVSLVLRHSPLGERR